MTIKCGAIGDAVSCERELFGYKEGGTVLREARLKEADGGTLVLLNIDELPLSVQARLLRFLQEHRFERIGDGEVISADARVVTSSKQGPQRRQVKAGRFREDLYYRLGVVSLRTPSLRERRDDIPLLAMHFLRRSATRARKQVVGFSERALGVMLSGDWPGNIRQLENCVERAVVMCRGAEIEPRDLPRELMARMRGDDAAPVIPAPRCGSSTLRDSAYAQTCRRQHQQGGEDPRDLTAQDPVPAQRVSGDPVRSPGGRYRRAQEADS